MAARATAAAPSLRDVCVGVLATCLHRMPLATFTSVVWPEECLLSLLEASSRATVFACLRAARAPDARCAARLPDAQRTLSLGRLTEHTLSLFAAVAAEHPRLAARLRALNIQPLPPLAPSSSTAWLGQRSNLY